jgi:hypothetical protein
MAEGHSRMTAGWSTSCWPASTPTCWATAFLAGRRADGGRGRRADRPGGVSVPLIRPRPIVVRRAQRPDRLGGEGRYFFILNCYLFPVTKGLTTPEASRRRAARVGVTTSPRQSGTMRRGVPLEAAYSRVYQVPSLLLSVRGNPMTSADRSTMYRFLAW